MSRDAWARRASPIPTRVGLNADGREWAPGAILGTWTNRGLPFRTRCTVPAPPGRCSSEISRRPRRTWRACARATWLGFSSGSPSSLLRSPCASRGGSGLGDGWVPGIHRVRDEYGPESDAASMELGRVRFGLSKHADPYFGLPTARRRGDDSEAGSRVGELTRTRRRPRRRLACSGRRGASGGRARSRAGAPPCT